MLYQRKFDVSMASSKIVSLSVYHACILRTITLKLNITECWRINFWLTQGMCQAKVIASAFSAAHPGWTKNIVFLRGNFRGQRWAQWWKRICLDLRESNSPRMILTMGGQVCSQHTCFFNGFFSMHCKVYFGKPTISKHNRLLTVSCSLW